MAVSKKNRIVGLSKKIKFRDAARLIVDARLRVVLKDVGKYLNSNSVKNLHSLRISFRRLRYALELFYDCFEKKSYTHLLNALKKMQDHLGAVRDLDVMLQKSRKIETDSGIKLSNEYFVKIEEEKNLNVGVVKTELTKFGKDKKVNSFLIDK